MVRVALLCTQYLPSHRPKMSEVVRMLEGDGLAEKWEASHRAESTRGRANEFSSSERYSDLTDDSSLLVQAMELSGPRWHHIAWLWKIRPNQLYNNLSENSLSKWVCCIIDDIEPSRNCVQLWLYRIWRFLLFLLSEKKFRANEKREGLELVRIMNLFVLRAFWIRKEIHYYVTTGIGILILSASKNPISTSRFLSSNSFTWSTTITLQDWQQLHYVTNIFKEKCTYFLKLTFNL